MRLTCELGSNNFIWPLTPPPTGSVGGPGGNGKFDDTPI
jgi:hypothetical protein